MPTEGTSTEGAAGIGGHLNLYLNCIDGGWTSIGVGEVVVVVVEAVCYYLLLRRIDTAIIYSLLCNAISFLTGCLVLLLAALV